MCFKGMIRGKRQAVDSVFIKANASMDSLVEKSIGRSPVPCRWIRRKQRI
jgi:hypothetical protein